MASAVLKHPQRAARRRRQPILAWINPEPPPRTERWYYDPIAWDMARFVLSMHLFKYRGQGVPWWLLGSRERQYLLWEQNVGCRQ